jgi:hypothetical protein
LKRHAQHAFYSSNHGSHGFHRCETDKAWQHYPTALRRLHPVISAISEIRGPIAAFQCDPLSSAVDDPAGTTVDRSSQDRERAVGIEQQIR